MSDGSYTVIEIVMTPSTDRVRSSIASHGWHVIMVPEDEEGPSFAYSVGMGQTFNHPEIIIFGLPLDIMQLIVNNIGEEVRQGACFRDGDASVEILENHPVKFRTVSHKFYDDYLGQAISFYGGSDFTVLQCYWPDSKGLFPWQLGYGGVVHEQPSLQAGPTGGPAD